MEKNVILRKVFINKRNMQGSITLPKKKMMKMFNGNMPKKIRLKVEGAEW
jgi:hypothetical protein